MKLVGLMPVRNEAWCLGFTLRVALQWCDAVVLALHNCTDESLQIVADVQSEVTDRLSYFRIEEPNWAEMEHRQKLLSGARDEHSATHIALIDADEFLTANLVERMPTLVKQCTESFTYMLELPGYNIRELHGSPGLNWFHSNGVWGNRWFATAFRDVAAAHWGGDQFHHREPMGVEWRKWRPVDQGHGGTLHLWGASERRLAAKHALYRVTERLRWPKKPAVEIERLYSLATNAREPWTFKNVPWEWIAPYQELTQYLQLDAEPWQVAEVKRLVAEHGRETFTGLDLLGVPEW